MIVADASAMLEVLLKTPASTAIATQLFAPRQTIHVPHLMDVEILQALRRYNRTKIISDVRARQAVEDYSAMSLTRYPHHVLLPRMWELRHNLSACGAVYIALAEALDSPLVSCDRALASVPGLRAKVLVL